VSVLGREVHAVGDALKPIEAVALDNDPPGHSGVYDRGYPRGRSEICGKPSGCTRSCGVDGTNSRAYWNFESSPLQQRVSELSVPRPSTCRDTAEIDGRLLEELVAANTGKNVIAFTHKPALGGDSVAV
jgi:hypothetical protein